MKENGLNDQECRAKTGFNDLCEVHRQSVFSCANDRLRQIKQAREMADRRTRWATVWKESACNTRKEINALKEGLIPHR
jgi:hypothetical protein